MVTLHFVSGGNSKSNAGGRGSGRSFQAGAQPGGDPLKSSSWMRYVRLRGRLLPMPARGARFFFRILASVRGSEGRTSRPLAVGVPAPVATGGAAIFSGLQGTAGGKVM